MNGPVLRKIESILEKYVIDNLYQYQVVESGERIIKEYK